MATNQNTPPSNNQSSTGNTGPRVARNSAGKIEIDLDGLDDISSFEAKGIAALKDDMEAASTRVNDVVMGMRSMTGVSEDFANSIESQLADINKMTDEMSKMTDATEILQRTQLLRNDIVSSGVDMDEAELELLTQQIDALTNVLMLHKKIHHVIDTVNGITDSIVDGIKSQVSAVSSFVENVPYIGGILSKLIPTDLINEQLDFIGSTFKNTFSIVFMGAMISGATASVAFSTAFRSAMAATKAAAISAFTTIKNVISPFTIWIALVVAGIALAITAFNKMDEAVKSLAEKTGLLMSQIEDLGPTLMSIESDFADIGVTMEGLVETTSAFITEFGGIEKPTRDVIANMTVLNKNFGISSESVASLNKLFQNMGNLTAEQGQYLETNIALLAKSANVAPDAVFKDISESSAMINRYFRGMPKDIGKTTIMLKKMGSSLQSALKTTESLLNFEESITNEMEASALLGRSLDFTQARMFAAAGDTLGQEKAITRELEKIGDLQSLTVWQKDALAKATGKEFSELLNMQRIRQRFGDLGEKDLETAHQMIAAGKDLQTVTLNDLKAQTERTTVMEDMGNKFSAIGTKLLNSFVDIGKELMPVFESIATVVAFLFKGFLLLGPIIKVAMLPILIAASAINWISESLKPIFDYLSSIKPLVDFIATSFNIIGYVIGTVILFALASWVKTMATSLITSMGSLIGRLMIASGLMSETAVAAFATATAMSWGLAAIAIIGSIAAIVAAFKSAKSNASESSPSINDGVVQDGKVVTTHPDDFLIATKNPGELANTLAGSNKPITQSVVNNDNSDMTHLLSELIQKTSDNIEAIKKLHSDLIGGKIAVYLDGKKVVKELGIIVSNSTLNSYGNRK